MRRISKLRLNRKASTLAVLCALLMPGSALAAQPEDLPSEDGEDELVLDDEVEMEGEEPAPDAGGDGGDDLDLDLGGDGDKDDTSAGNAGLGADRAPTEADPDAEAKQLAAEQGLITVVQRQRMLKRKRIDLQPQFGISINDPYVRHYSFGAELNFWLTNRMALGLTGTGFLGNKTPRYANIRVQEGILLTANRVLWQASLNYLYNPFYGKLAVFNRFLLHWEGYVQLGGGAIQTEVIPRFESLHEPFSNITYQGNVALGTRFYLPQPINFLSINAGVRHFVFPDKLEPFDRGPGTAGFEGRPELDPPDGAKAEALSKLGHHTMLFFGLSFYFPATFDYTTPR